MKKNRISLSSESKKRSEASKKGWVTRRLLSSQTKTSRTLNNEKLEKLQKEEKIRNSSRRKAQKKGRSLVSDKPKLNLKKPPRPASRASKKRVSVR